MNQYGHSKTCIFRPYLRAKKTITVAEKPFVWLEGRCECCGRTVWSIVQK